MSVVVALRLYYFPIYARTWDAGQFCENVKQLYLGHAPYIYHHTLGTALAFFWDEDVALSLLSTIGLLISTVCIYRIALLLYRQPLLAALASTVFVFIPVTLSFSAIQEVYSLQSGLVLAAFMYACLRRNRLDAFKGGLCFALAFGTHYTTILIAPALLLILGARLLGAQRRAAACDLASWAQGVAVGYTPALVFTLSVFIVNRNGPLGDGTVPGAVQQALAYLNPFLSDEAGIPKLSVLVDNLRGFLEARPVLSDDVSLDRVRGTMRMWVLDTQSVFLSGMLAASAMVCALRFAFVFVRRRLYRIASMSAFLADNPNRAVEGFALFVFVLPYFVFVELKTGKLLDPGLHLLFVAPLTALALPYLASFVTSDPRVAALLRRGHRVRVLYPIVFGVGFFFWQSDRLAADLRQEQRLEREFEALRSFDGAMPEDAFFLTNRDAHRIPYYANRRSLQSSRWRGAPTVYAAFVTPRGTFSMHVYERMGLSEFRDFVKEHPVFHSSLLRKSPPLPACNRREVAEKNGVTLFEIVDCP